MRLFRRLAAWVGLSVALAAAAALVITAGGLAATAAVGLPGSATATAEPSTAPAGSTVTFQITCASLAPSSATLSGTLLGLPEQIPMSKQGSDTGVFAVTVTLPRDIQPGTYHPDIDCSDGSSASATLHVTALPAAGGVATGDGTTSTQTNNGLANVGLVLIGAGAVLGGIAMRRRGSRSRS